MKISPFDPAEYLDTDEAVAAFLEDAIASGDQRVYQDALNIAARARKRILDEERRQPRG